MFAQTVSIAAVCAVREELECLPTSGIRVNNRAPEPFIPASHKRREQVTNPSSENFAIVNRATESFLLRVLKNPSIALPEEVEIGSCVLGAGQLIHVLGRGKNTW